ncbi:MAG: hypothetical protein WBA51_17085 [Erythrobacter sp.]
MSFPRTRAISKAAAAASALTIIVATLSACSAEVEPPAPTPAPTPAPVAARPVAPPPVVREPLYENYLDAPQTAGTWKYTPEPSETLATFGEAGSLDSVTFIVRCDTRTGKIGLGRVVSSPTQGTRVMSVTTETTTRQLQAELVEARPPIFAAELDPRDPLFDAMAITKGRFAIGVEGESTLYLPAWAEVTRVIEDCR